MFRKPKRAKKGGVIRRRTTDAEEGVDSPQQQEQQQSEESTTELLSQARKRTRMMTSFGRRDEKEETAKSSVMHQYDVSKIDIQKRNADLVTSTSEHHPQQQQSSNQNGTAQVGDDGIFRDKTRSRLLAGPVKITSHVRTTCRFDYQPDICKDYKDTGFCGFGDTCIYLHDRGDTLSGWQLEQKWEEEQKQKKDQQQREIQGFLDGDAKTKKSNVTSAAAVDDGLPYACHICRKPFTSPVVTACAHFFCEKCIMNHVRNESESCPICSTDTHGVFNQPTKLIAKKRRTLGAAKASQPNSWELFAEALSQAATTESAAE